MNVLQTGEEHCWEVRRVGLVAVGREVLEAEAEAEASRRVRAHAPGLLHWCAVSVRWSRQ